MMKIAKGENIIVHDRRKGTFKAVATEDFDTELDEFYPVISREFVRGAANDWDIGERVPCRKGISEIKVERQKAGDNDDNG